MHAKALQAGVACCDPPARPARPAAWLSTSQPCARAGQSTEGSKGSFESGRTSRGATSNAPSGSSTKRRLDGADMRSPPLPPSQTRRSWAAAAMAPPRAPPRGPCAGLGCHLCRWCLGPLAVAHEHGEDGCSSRQKPSLADWTRHAATQPEPTPNKPASCSRPLHPLIRRLESGRWDPGPKRFWCVCGWAGEWAGGRVGAIADWPLPGCRTDLENGVE